MIAISDAVRRYMAGPALGVDGQALDDPLGIDAAPFAAVPKADVERVRHEWGLPEGSLAIGFVGRLVDQKDLRHAAFRLRHIRGAQRRGAADHQSGKALSKRDYGSAPATWPLRTGSCGRAFARTSRR